MNKLQEINIDEVLVIEDDPIFSRLNAHMIKNILGASCRIFEDASKAISYLDEREMGGKKLVLLDLNMPGMTGWDFLDVLENKNYKNEIGVIIITSSLFKEDKERSKRYQPVKAFFTKPVKKTEFTDFLMNELSI